MSPALEAMLKRFGGEDLREGSRAVDQYPRTKNQGWSDREIAEDWEDYVEVPVHVLERIAAALK